MKEYELLYLFFIFSFLSSIRAIFHENDKITFHIPLIGVPLKESIFFHKPVSYQNSLIYLATEKNILAAINSKDGSLVWRQKYAENDPINAIKSLDSKIITLSNSSIVRAWNALTGFLIWEETYQNFFLDNRHAIKIFENNITSNKDIVLLTSNTIYFLDSNTGSQIWCYEKSVKRLPIFLSISSPFVYVVESRVSSNTYFISVSKLDGKTGNKIASNNLFSISKLDDIIYVGNSPLPIIVWKDSNTYDSINVYDFDRNITHIIDIEMPFSSVKLYSPENSNVISPSFLLHFVSSSYKKSWASVFSFKPNSSILKLYEISSISATSCFFPTIYAFDIFFIHSYINNFGSITIDKYGDKNNSILNTWNISLNQSNSRPEQIVSFFSQKNDNLITIKSVIVMSDGVIYMVKESSILWHREESLAYSIHAEFLQLPQKHIVLIENDSLKKSNFFPSYIKRIIGHVNKLKEIIKYIVSSIEKRFSKEYKDTSNMQKAGLRKNVFGLKQIIIVITSKGKILALDPFLSGIVIWSNNLGSEFDYKGLWIVKKSKTLNDIPVIAVLGRCLQDMHFWRINGLTGEIINFKKVDNDIKNSFILDHILTDDSNENIVIGITEDKKIKLLYDTSKTLPISVLENLSNIYFSTRNLNTLEGYFLDFKNLYASITWTIDFPLSESIISLSFKNKNEKIASIGRVLGDRSVLYKYLNSHFLAVATGNKVDSKLNIYLIDIVKGMILHTNHYNNVDISKGVEILLTENWIVYQFWIEKPTKGYQIVISELYESEIKNKRNKGANSTSIYNIPLPFVISQAYLYPRRIYAFTSVLTRYGISSRDIISYIDSNQIVVIPKKLLDPQRPILANNKISSASIKELIPYDVNLFIDSKIVISSKNEVYGIKNILSSPTLLESTSLILAYGHDIFFTYVTPSNSFDVLNPNFNKLQLLLTISLLIVGLLLLRSMAKVKLLKKKWSVI
ncbi:hypothetical protein T552_02971 [Pneumocystis carinii B80]|uniref:ER membrane protein complex subunit 1 n=1 Tax=Pneumocystis carinii (strain B80) TaxID=1408658 RepID=A0A0W4ZCS7_PNEC8|nr:hypothetical protein T552_02971 [Pneumocystis carinii B80]KTW26078.1 hypothetical protein T552_02971 [Pneumocystis carinii B80]